MKIKTLLVLILLVLAADTSTITAQDMYFTREGHISFFSETSVEEIKADNYKATSVLNASNGNLEFAVLIKGFNFDKALMQEHFNENYMESDEFPKAIFKGQIDDFEKIDLTTDGDYPIKVSGNLTIHGVTNSITTDASIKVENGEISAQSIFVVEVADYGIEIPGVVSENIAKEIEISVDLVYALFEK